MSLDDRSRVWRIRALLAVLCLFFALSTASGKIVAHRDPRNGVLDAEIVVLVRQLWRDHFLVDEVYLGEAHIGDSLELPGFKLFTAQQYGPDIVDPITPNTRILLFLEHKKDAPEAWIPTYFGESFFWVQNPEEVDRLKTMAKDAVALRREWERVVSIQDARSRVEGLWPYLALMRYGPSFLDHTKKELLQTGSVAGDYFSDQFDSMPRQDRALLYADAGAYGSEKLHVRLREHLRQQEEGFESLLRASGLVGRDALANWNTLPENVKDAYAEICYGLAGLGRFKNPGDLPLIRESATWAIKYQSEQTSEAALDAFRAMPDRNNLAAISVIAEEFAARPPQTASLLRIALIRALCAHKFVETVPLLTPFIGDDFAGNEVEAALSEIVGQDLGKAPQPWLAWYAARRTGT